MACSAWAVTKNHPPKLRFGKKCSKKSEFHPNLASQYPRKIQLAGDLSNFFSES